ncbi:hypothetical protein C8R45DRAFT_982834 [Mycena sanguinolenta]|nr:hypothetical protein C8R45DRAFT_982834 [Mycena sanguinolenta]
MGTRGYRVYRHNGYYHVHYNHWDSYPEGLGVKVAAEIPHNPEAYKEWLERLRKSLDELEKNQSETNYESNYFITQERPANDIMIEWVYEIDLDHEVFLVDANPLFALNNMPPTSESFVEWIGVDSYGHRAYDPSTPEKHIYNWKAAAPSVDDYVIQEYAARQPNLKKHPSISQLLGTESTESTDNCKAVRIALYEAVISQMMHAWEIGHHIRVLETASERADIPENMLSLAVDLVQITVGPMLFGKELKYAPNVKGLAFSWLTTDICLRVTTHLDDERNLKKSILELVDEVVLNRQPGIVTYGILFSFFHCVIVHVDLNQEFESTGVLQFMPSFSATSPFTPGITAIGSLAYHCLDTVANDTVNPDHFLSQVPVEVLELIAARVTLFDLHRLCVATPFFEPAAGAVLRFPHIENYCLSEVSEGGELKNMRLSLGCKTFTTTVKHADGPALVIGSEGHRTGLFKILFGDSVKQVGWEVADASR